MGPCDISLNMLANCSGFCALSINPTVSLRPEWVSRGFCGLLGHSETELLSLCFTDMLHPEDSSEASDVLRICAETGQEFSRRWRFISHAGNEFLLSVSVMPLSACEGHLLLLFNDISTETAEISRLLFRNRATQNLMLNLPNGFFTCSADKNHSFHFLGEGLLSIFGYSESDFLSVFSGQFDRMIYEPDRRATLDAIAKDMDSFTFSELCYRAIDSNGRLLWLFHRGHVVVGPSGDKLYYVAIADISDQKETEEKLRTLNIELRLQTERYRLLLEIADELMFEYNPETDTIILPLTHSNDPDCRRELAFNDYVRNYIHPDDFSTLQELRQELAVAPRNGKIDMRSKFLSSDYRWLAVTFGCVINDDGSVLRVIGRTKNIQREKEQEQRLLEMARTDISTMLLNKAATRYSVENFLQSEAPGASHAILLIDIDDLKRINDNLGHLYGDRVIRDISDVIRRLFRPDDISGRIGGDEFMVLMKNTDEHAALQKARTLCSAFSSSKSSSEAPWSISVSVGISLYPCHGLSHDDLYSAADHALYESKRHGKNCFTLFAPPSHG